MCPSSTVHPRCCTAAHSRTTCCPIVCACAWCGVETRAYKAARIMHLLLVRLARPLQEVLVGPVPAPLPIAPHDAPPEHRPCRLHRRLLFGRLSLPRE